LLYQYAGVSTLIYLAVLVAGLAVSRRFVSIQKDRMLISENRRACRLVLRIESELKLSPVEALRFFFERNPQFFSIHTVLWSRNESVLWKRSPRAKELPPPPEAFAASECDGPIGGVRREITFLKLDSDTVLQADYRPRSRELLDQAGTLQDKAYRIQRRHPMIFSMLPETVNSIILLVFLLLGFFFSFATVVILIRKAAREAARVIDEIKSGNLKSRITIGIRGGIANRFNEMADEIEKLVEQLRQAETIRTQILQELAHDLKTPVASLRGIVETLSDRRDRMSSEQIDDFLESATSETLYFSRLVEDLLFISGVSDPHYKASLQKIDLCDLLREMKIEFQGPSHAPILGEKILLTRLLRNGLENAFSFARTHVDVFVEKEENHWIIRIVDDGPGASPEEYANFGIKRKTRREKPVRTDRISIGMGSVIMRKIAQAYGGEVSLSPRKDSQPGAELKIRLRC